MPTTTGGGATTVEPAHPAAGASRRHTPQFRLAPLSLSCGLRGPLEEFVDQSLVGLRLSGGQPAKLGEQARRDPDSDQLLGAAGFRPADAACALQLRVGRFGDI